MRCSVLPGRALLLLLAPLLACGQAVPPPASPASQASPSTAVPPSVEAVQLSPFEVNTSRDTGFAAASSMAGGRLATDLRDTPVSYSVITRDFIDALNLTDLESAADWTTSSTIYPDNGQQLFFVNPVQYTTRGAGSGRPQRNFFPQFNNGDSYNLERYDFGRGPNSILFGNGSLSGISSSTTKRAQTNKPSRQLQFQVGSWDNFRSTVDINQPLTDKLAFRAVGLWQDAGGWRLKDFDKRKAAFLTTTFKPYRGGELRLEGEYGTNSRQSAATFLNDRFSGWNGIDVYNRPAALATLPADAAARGIDRRGANYLVYLQFEKPATIFNYQNDPITRAGGSNATTPIAGFTYGSGASFNTNGANLYHEINVPANRFAIAEARSAYRTPGEQFTMSPDEPILAQRFKDLQLTYTQRLGNLHFELAGDINRTAALVHGEPNRGLTDTFIDINQVLPDGSPNPNFLKPYADARVLKIHRKFAENNARAAIAYVWPTRFGHFTANALGGRNHSQNEQDHRYLSVARGADQKFWAYNNQQVRVRRYWDRTSRPGVEIAGLPITYFDPNTNVTETIRPIWAIEAQRRDTNRIDTNKATYALASLNAKFFQGRWVVLGAIRRDSYRFSTDQQIDAGDYPADWPGTYRILRSSAPADYATLTYQAVDAQGRPAGDQLPADIRPRDANSVRLPQYANVRFRDDYNPPPVVGTKVTRSIGTVLHLKNWLNPAFNYAETFNPPGAIVRIDGRQLEPTVAKGMDYSLRMELFENKLNLNFTYFQTEEINNQIPQDGPGFFNTLYDANVIGDTSSTGRNIRGIGRLPTQYRDTRTRTGDGYEIEVVYNPSRALRLTANVGLPRVYESNANPDVRDYIDRNAALFRQIATDAGVLIGSDNVARVDESIPVNQRSSDVNGARDAYNNIYSFRRNIVDGERLAQDQPIVNVFADYTIQSGRLKGLRLGTGARYRGKQIYWSRVEDTIVDPSNPTRAIDDPTKDAYTPAYTPEDYVIVTGTIAYNFRLKNRQVQANLVINNLLNDRGPNYSSSAQNAHVMRPLNGDYNSPAREAVPRYFALKQPISFTLTLTTRL
jgi:outer membrane receptor protein involved in Fe transport